MNNVASGIKALGSVSQIVVIERICTREGWDVLKEALKGSKINRLLISACMPYAYTAKLKELGLETGLNPALMDVIDIRTLFFKDQTRKNEQMDQDIRRTISMAASKLKGMDPFPPVTRKIIQKGLVVGGGIAGITSALAIADQGFHVDIIEKDSSLGGNLNTIHRTIDGLSPRELLEDIITRTEKHSKVKVHTNSRIIHSRGRVGDFSTTIEGEDGVAQTIEHGVTILATGGSEARTQSYGYGQSESIMTQHELENKIADGTLDTSSIKSIAMIQCVDSREEPRNYCSRICCSTALKNALYIKEHNPDADVFIFYRDIMTYGFLESYYTKARKSGIIFIPYTTENKPDVSVKNEKPLIKALEPILDRVITIDPDLLILGTGIVPNNVEDLAELFGVEVNRDGFFQEAESKWRPMDFIKEGIFMTGIAHSPRSISESIATAEAAAQRALRILDSDSIVSDISTAQVRRSLFSLCERCIQACPYGARRHDEEEEMIVVDELMCQGCGSCAEVCPNSASILIGYRDQQLFGVIDSALEDIC
jgi:heterodisulfide reductase subunit A